MGLTGVAQRQRGRHARVARRGGAAQKEGIGSGAGFNEWLWG